MKSLLSTLLENRILILELAKRDIRDRYVGQIFGYVWFLLNSVFTIIVYIFLFGFIYKSNKIPANNFPLYLISGFVPWTFLTESMSKAVISISSNSALVKQVVFPIEVLPIKVVLGASISLGLNLIILCTFSIYMNGLNGILLMLPILIICLILFALGIAFMLSAIGSFLKDLKDVVQFFSSIGIYLIPIVYFESLIPSSLKPFTLLNPFTHVVFCFQDVFYYEKMIHVNSWFILPLISICLSLIGFSFFKKFKFSIGNFL